MIKRRNVIAGAAGWTIVGASSVRAQAWPSQQIKIVVPYVPGGGNTTGGKANTAARLLAENLTPLVGQQVIVENRGHIYDTTIIGTELVARSKPDGYTLLLGTTTLATNAALGLKQPYDPLKDFQPVTTLADMPHFIAVNKDLPVKDYKEFADWVNKQPQKVRYITHSRANQPHLWAELFRSRNKLNLENTAYAGIAALSARFLYDVIDGIIPIVIDVVNPTGVQAAQGRLKGIIVSSEKRSPVCPDVPTVVELRMPDMVSAVFFGVVAPAGVPRPALDKLNGLIRRVIKQPDVEKKFADLGYVTTGSTPEEYHAKLKFETERWAKVVKDNNIKVEG